MVEKWSGGGVVVEWCKVVMVVRYKETHKSQTLRVKSQHKCVSVLERPGF